MRIGRSGQAPIEGNRSGAVDGPAELTRAARLDWIQTREQPAAIERLAIGTGNLPLVPQPFKQHYRSSRPVLLTTVVSRCLWHMNTG